MMCAERDPRAKPPTTKIPPCTWCTLSFRAAMHVPHLPRETSKPGPSSHFGPDPLVTKLFESGTTVCASIWGDHHWPFAKQQPPLHLWRCTLAVVVGFEVVMVPDGGGRRVLPYSRYPFMGPRRSFACCPGDSVSYTEHTHTHTWR